MFPSSFSSRGRQVLVLALVAVLAALLFVSPTYAQGPTTPTVMDLRANDIYGVLPSIGSPLLQQPSNASGNLDYHGGPVMHTNKIFTIFWIPSGYSVSTGYVGLINGFFKNVAAASGQTSNVYYSDTQYYDGSGFVHYSSSFGGSYLDTHAFPTSGCSDAYTAKCLTDGQIRAEIKRVMGLKGWPAGIGKLYFMFTPKNVGSCSGTACSYSTFCGYHSYTKNSSGVVIPYANMPYAAWTNCSATSQPKPNNNDADYTINVASHEQNEAITDPKGNAWWDSYTGNENGDNCAWNFGAAIGSTSYGAYNQAISTGKYYIQQEWSNFSIGCVLTGK